MNAVGRVPLGDLSPFLRRCAAGCRCDFGNTLLDLTPNTASKVVCTAARGGMVVVGDLGL
jgi:hypothetical protein